MFLKNKKMKTSSPLYRPFSFFFSLTRSILIFSIFFAAFALKSRAQAGAGENKLDELLKHYLAVKEALVKGNSSQASSEATLLVKNINSISYRLISEGNVSALRKDATAIAKSGNISTQRKAFSNLSSNMVALAGKFKLIDQPVYLQYCPMANASWLSKEKEIRNPYYGSAMLTCGEVKKIFEW